MLIYYIRCSKQGEKDDKINIVCDYDPEYRHYIDIKELRPHRLAEINTAFLMRHACDSSIADTTSRQLHLLNKMLKAALEVDSILVMLKAALEEDSISDLASDDKLKKMLGELDALVNKAYELLGNLYQMMSKVYFVVKYHLFCLDYIPM
ncbi:Soluble inorganic pyrophosphatase [Dendrobium catenatum]|uniref:Soluble inorganic pyrophosphatase n=1 Tax=Dendrobium catenatum TaxID=906689 RepID=A0A2I0VD97_9ASPA|nr:Soluble inorganic pyrophosphatase [Dendrobium catenatum]